MAGDLWRDSRYARSMFKRSDVIRPLRLVDLQPSEAVERSRRMSLRFPPANLTASPLYGVGGLGLAALALLVTIVMPGAWLVLLASMLAGVVLGIAMIVMHRRRALRPVRPVGSIFGAHGAERESGRDD